MGDKPGADSSPESVLSGYAGDCTSELKKKKKRKIVSQRMAVHQQH